jgi:hypothetical protein
MIVILIVLGIAGVAVSLFLPEITGEKGRP